MYSRILNDIIFYFDKGVLESKPLNMWVSKIKVAMIMDTAFSFPPTTGFNYRVYHLTKYLQKHGIEVIVPEKADRDLVSEVVYKELCCGIFSEKSKREYLRVIDGLVAKGAQGVALACTEIPLLVKNGEAAIPLYETTYLHAMAAVDGLS